MEIWIQSLSWAMMYALVQGFVVYSIFWSVTKLWPTISAKIQYLLSLACLMILFIGFIATWWQQYHSFQQTSVYLPVQQQTLQYVLTSTPRVILKYNFTNLLVTYLSLLFPWLSAFYFTGFFVLLTRLVFTIPQLQALKSTGVMQPDGEILVLLNKFKERLQLRTHVEVLISIQATVPMVVGFVKPVILLPVATIAQLSTQQLETILLHELAHIKRHDFLVNILQTIIETVLFFNPFVWLISTNIRRERELCCDDLVMAHTHEPLVYATALATLAQNTQNTLTLALAATGTKKQLFHRIKRIMEMKKNAFSYSQMAAAIVITLTIACSVAWLSPSFALPKHEKDLKAATITKTQMKSDNGNNQQESTQLMLQLLHDRLVDENKGFIVERKQNTLIINGEPQTEAISNRYLNAIKQQTLRIQVFSLQERLRLHPESGILQMVAPVMFTSPCIDNSAAKPGC